MTVAAFQELLMPAEASAVALSSLKLANGDTVVLRRLTSLAAATPSPAPSTAPDSAPTASFDAAASISTNVPEPQLTSLPYQGHLALDQESEDEQLARAIAASLGQETTSSSAAELVPQAAPQAGSSGGQNGSHTVPNGSQAFQNGSAASASGSTSASVTLPDGSCVVRRKVDDDNSCLFSAVGYVMEGTRSHATKLRRVIADAVAADPFTYNDGFLGKSNAEYRKWILDPKKWGGAIELSIFARHFAREIAAYDIQTKRCDVYGQGEGYRERVMLIYDGLHYDALAVAGTHTASFTQGLLSCASQAVIALTQGSMLAEFCQPMFLLCARACQAVFECLKCMAPCCFCTTMLHRSISFTELSG
ncbi:TPA: hypothetical protein ACH3X2_002587 [Trebouxia sp. C0005]